MDEQTWLMWRTLARYVIFLAIVLLMAAALVTWMVIELLPDTATEKIAIVAGLAGAVAGGLTGMISAVGAGFVALVNTRKNISVTEAQGEVKPPTP